MQASISFRPLERSDFPLLQEWLSAPHVAVWWNERTDLVSVEAKYGPRVDGTEPTHVFVIEHEGRPIGWIQWYLWADYPEHARQSGAETGSAGIDLAIGKLKMTGQRSDIALLRIGDDSADSGVLEDELLQELADCGAFEKAGFKVAKTVQLVGEGCKRQIVRLDRPSAAIVRVDSSSLTP